MNKHCYYVVLCSLSPCALRKVLHRTKLHFRELQLSDTLQKEAPFEVLRRGSGDVFTGVQAVQDAPGG